MTILLALNAIIAIVIAIVLVVGFFKNYNKDQLHKSSNWITLNSLLYISLALFFTLWFLNSLEYTTKDFNIIYAVIILIQTFVLLKIVHLISNDRNVYYLLFGYIITLIAAYFSFLSFSLLAIATSFLLTLIISLNLISLSPKFKRFGAILFLYASISLIVSLISFFYIESLFNLVLISQLIFLWFIILFLRDFQDYPQNISVKSKKQETSKVFLFIKYLIFIIVITNLVLISTVGLHEFGHVAVAHYYGCDAKAIFFETGQYSHAEILCADLDHKDIITLAGPVIPIFLGVLLLILGGSFVKPIALLTIGFNLIASAKDFQDLGLTESLILGASLLGLVIFFIGLAWLTRGRLHTPWENIV